MLNGAAYSELDLNSGVDLNNWPNAYIQRNSGATTVISQWNLTTGAVSNIAGVVSAETGIVSSDNVYQCQIPQGCTGRVTECGVSDAIAGATKYYPIRYSYRVKPNISGIFKTADRVYGTDNRSHSYFQIYDGYYFLNAGMKQSSVSYVLNQLNQYRLDLTEAQMNQQVCNPMFGSNCTLTSYDTNLQRFCMPTLGTNAAGQSTSTGTWKYCMSDSYYANLGSPYGNFAFNDCMTRGGYYGASLIQNKGAIGYFSGNVGIPGFSGQETQSGVITSATGIGMNNPQGITGNAQGEFIVADFGNNRVRKINHSSNVITTIAGNGGTGYSGDGGPATSASIYHPKEVIYDGIGNLYIATESGYIRKVDLSGNISTYAGLPITSGGSLADGISASEVAFNNPGGMVIDKDNGFLYIADTGNNRIVRIDMNTKIANVVAGTGSCNSNGLANGTPALAASLCAPHKIGLDNNKNLIVIDPGHNLVRRVVFNSGGTDIQFAPTIKDLSKLTKNSDGTWTRTYRNGNIVNYNSLGQQTNAIDRLNRRKNFEYTNGLLTAVVHQTTGQRTELNYSGNQLSSIKDPAGRFTYFTISGNKLASVSFPDGSAKSYSYDPKGLLLQETNERNFSTAYEYDGYSRLKKVTYPDGGEVLISDTKSQTIDADPTQTEPLKNAGFGVVQIADRVIDARGIETDYKKDLSGLITKIKDAAGAVTEIQYDLDGNPLRVKFPDNAIVSASYDTTTGDLLKVTDESLSLSKSFLYNSFGQIIENRNEKNYSHIFTYNLTNGLLGSETLPGGKIVSYSYTSKGQISSKITSEAGVSFALSYEYDSNGNQTKITDNGGNYQTAVYDLAGNILQARSFPGGSVQRLTQYSYDLRNRLTQVISPLNETTSYLYDASGNLKKITAPNSSETLFVYDPRNRAIQKTLPEGGTHIFSYDKNNNLTQQTDPNGNIRTFVYNNINKVQTATLPDDVYSYTYDLRGKIASLENNTSGVIYQKDLKGRVISVNSFGKNALSAYPFLQQTVGYDELSNVTSILTNVINLTYGYDALNRLTGLSTSAGASYSFEYNVIDRLKKVTRPNGYSNYNYTSSGMTDQISNYSNGNVLKSFVGYGYDQSNLPIQKRLPAGNLDYAYDLNSQLTQVSNSTSTLESFTYDNLGNRLTDQIGTFTYGTSSQRLSSDVSFNYFYDNNGNLINKYPKNTSNPAFKYYYNSLNQLVKFEKLASMVGAVVETTYYRYDVLGRRVEKQFVDSMSASNNETRRFLYLGDNIIAETDQSNAILVRYTHSPISADDILSMEITSAGVTAGLAASANTFYFNKDSVGSILEITDISANQIQRYEYSSFGIIQKIRDSSGNDVTNSAPIKNRFTYTGREFDKESGNFYYRARYYDSNSGRFLQQDPHPGELSNPITAINKYAYVGNSPIIFNDPTGKFFGFDDFGFLIYAGISAITTTASQLMTGQIKESEFFDALLRNFAISLFISIAGQAIGFQTLTNLNDWALGYTAELAVKNGIKTYIISGGIKIASNAFGADINPLIAVTAVLIYPEYKDTINQNLFILR